MKIILKTLLLFFFIIPLVFSQTCPSPLNFSFSPCEEAGCRFYVHLPNDWRAKTHPGNIDRTRTNHFEFRGASFGGPHNFYPRVVCDYQDPNNESILYKLTILSEALHKKAEFADRTNWTEDSSYKYICRSNDVADCSFG